MVIVSHYAWSETERLMLLFPFWIDMAVPIFMLISGYVYAISIEKNRIYQMEDAYRFSFICKKVVRYTIPFGIAFFLEMIMYTIAGSGYNLVSGIITFIDGGRGPGSYYYPIMMQFIFIFPLIYFPIRKNPKRGLIVSFMCNLIYEVLQRAYGLNEETYRLLVFRYILLIAFGCFMFLYNEKIKMLYLLISFMVGVIYIIVISYTNYKSKIIIYWKGTSFIAALYVMPIFYLLIRKLGTTGGYQLLELLGKASFNIFLTQMVYYGKVHKIVYIFVESRAIQLLINIAICLILGTIFYIVESRITNMVIHKIESTMIRIENRIEKI